MGQLLSRYRTHLFSPIRPSPSDGDRYSAFLGPGIFYRIKGIYEQIQYALLQLHAISDYPFDGGSILTRIAIFRSAASLAINFTTSLTNSPMRIGIFLSACPLNRI